LGPAKSDHNFERRGFDFVFAVQLFGGRYVEFDDTRRVYGEHLLPWVWPMGFLSPGVYRSRG
jgi:hypothetical protein